MDDELEQEEFSSNFKKVVLVGDERCGKLGLIFSYFIGKLPPEEPQIYKEYHTEIEIDGGKVDLEIWVAPCQEHYSQIRLLTYEETEVILLCFSVDDPVSLTNAAEKWYPEIRQQLPNVPIILVGNKIDLRTDENTIRRLDDQSLKPVTYEQGKEIADRLKCYQYIENSAKSAENVKEVFLNVAAAILSK